MQRKLNRFLNFVCKNSMNLSTRSLEEFIDRFYFRLVAHIKKDKK